MRITWKVGVTTLSTVGAVLVERAYFHNWDWPLVSSVRWTIGGLATFVAVSYLSSFVFDTARGLAWSIVADSLALIAVGLTGLGLYYANSDYAVLLMLNAAAFWVTSIVRHLSVRQPLASGHA